MNTSLPRALALLVIIGAACTSLLVWVDASTRQQIDANWIKIENREFEAMGASFNGSERFRMRGTCDTHLGLFSSTQGYAGEIQWVGVYHHTPATLAIRATRHLETPGIGDFIVGSWIEVRDHESILTWTKMDAVSGATITQNALLRAVSDFRQQGQEHCD